MTAADQCTDFQISLSTTGVDLTGGTVTVRAYVQAGTGGGIQLYAQDDAYVWSTGLWTNLADVSGWQDIVLPLSAGTGAFDITATTTLGIILNAGAAGPWTDPSIIYVDSVEVTGSTASVGPWDFATNSYSLARNNYNAGCSVTGGSTWVTD